jgi:adenylate cyclase
VQAEIGDQQKDVMEQSRMRFRIGINLGDVMVQGEDLLGHGVNIAARIEALAAPGSIMISSNVFEQVRDKLNVVFEDQGSHRVKNISRPVHVYRVPSQVVLSRPAPRASRAAPLLERPAIAVLPFTNLSRDPEQNYFSDGLTEDLISALASWRTVPVIPRTSSFAYKGSGKDLKDIAQELNARYVVEGSVRKSGQRVRVTAQLTDASSDMTIWAVKLDRQVDDVFAMQDEITQRLSAALQPEIDRAEQKRSLTKRPRNLEAWDLYQRGQAALGYFTPEDTAKARQTFEQAIELDSDYSLAYSGLAFTHHRDVFWSYVADHEPSVAAMLEASQKAVALDNNSSDAHMVLGLANIWSREYDLAVSEQEQAIELNPSNAFAYVQLGHAFDLSGNPEDGIAMIAAGLRLNPKDARSHIFLSHMARAHLSARRYGDAISCARKAARRPPHPLKYLVLASSLGHLGRHDEACVALQMCDRLQPHFIERWRRRRVYLRDEDNAHVIEGLAKAGCPGELPKAA